MDEISRYDGADGRGDGAENNMKRKMGSYHLIISEYINDNEVKHELVSVAFKLGKAR